jgi:hypothetical protein
MTCRADRCTRAPAERDVNRFEQTKNQARAEIETAACLKSVSAVER